MNFFRNLTYHGKLTTSVGWNDTQASSRPFCVPTFPAQVLSAMLVSTGKGSCRHHRFARGLASWLVVIVKSGFPVDWSDSGWGHLDSKFYSKTLYLLWIVKNNCFLITKCIWFVNFKYIYLKKIIKLRKNSSIKWFIPFHVLIPPDVIWKKIITSIVSRLFHRDTHQFTAYIYIYIYMCVYVYIVFMVFFFKQNSCICCT